MSYKHKKIFILGTLLITIAGFLIPTNFVFASVSGTVAGIALSIFYPAIYAMGAAAQWIALALLGWAGSLFDYILSPEFNQVPFTKSLFVVNGWRITRNFANSFFMLVMIAIAFSTILRIDIFGINIKKTLPRLVIAALLINFSLVIGGLIIDAGQILMVTFTHGATSQGSLATFLQNEMKVGSLFAGPGFLDGLSGGSIESLKSISAVWFGAIFIGLAAFAFFMLSIMLIVRVVILWLLLIFAPLAWLAYIIPGTEQFWKQWWDIFLKQTFFGAIIGFFMYLAVQMAANLSAIQQFSKEVGTNIETSSKFLSNTSFILQYFTILVMLYLSVIAARRINNIGVQATFKVLGAARRVAMPMIRTTGVPAALGQIGRMLKEGGERYEAKMGAKISRPVGAMLGKIPLFKGAERVGMKELREALKQQWDGLSLDELKGHAKTETGVRRQVALEMLLESRVRLTPEEYIKMKTDITVEMAKEGQTGKEADKIKDLLEGLKPQMKGGQYTKQEVTEIVTNEALLKEYLRNVEFFKDVAVKEMLPDILTPEIIDKIMDPKNENASVRVQKEIMDALNKHQEKKPKPKPKIIIP